MPTFSVLITSYNHARYIRACVDSVLQQTRPADEIIVCDNGSTDGSIEILRSYGNRIQLHIIDHDRLLTKRCNAARCMQQAFFKSRCQWSLFLDSDDLFHPAKIEQCERAAVRSPEASLIQSSMRWIDADGTDLGHYRDPNFHRDDHRTAVFQQQDCDFFYPTSALCVNRRVCETEMPLDFSIAPELAADTRLGIASIFYGRVVTLEAPLCSWRRHTGSMSRRDSTAQRLYLLSLA